MGGSKGVDPAVARTAARGQHSGTRCCSTPGHLPMTETNISYLPTYLPTYHFFEPLMTALG